MSILTAAAVLCVAFALAWRFDDTLPGVLPTVVCTVGLTLYTLAFVNRLSWIDGILLLCAAAAAAWMIRETRKKGRKALADQAGRLLADPYFWVGAAAIVLMCFLLRNAQILDWDSYNVWGPDTKSLYYRDGFAPKYANVSSEFGDYPPFAQLIWWWGAHLLGDCRERYFFFAYYAFGAILLFSAASRFRPRSGGWRGWLAAAVSCAAAVALPGVACTAWYRGLYVDPLMAMLFGCILGLAVCREEGHPGFWRAKMTVFLLCLPLVKTIGLLWAALGAAFWWLWWKERREEWRYPLAALGGSAALFGSWKLFCAVMERSTALVTSFSTLAGERLGELLRGEFFTAGNNWGYIKSYAKAFLFFPIHRETTAAIDLSPAALAVLLLAGAALLWRFGFVSKKKLGRLMGFMVLTLLGIYTILTVGQLTMFYPEIQYLEPLNAVTLMTRYCSPANIGLLLLLASLAAGGGTEGESALPELRRLAAWAVCGAVLFSCGPYNDLYRRFIYDPLDSQRIEKRQEFRTAYAPFLDAVKDVPLDREGARVLLGVYGMSFNPIVINEAAPVGFRAAILTEDGGADFTALQTALAGGHESYLYLTGCTPALAELLSACTDGGAFRPGVLYSVASADPLALREA